jgi:hypothetical protein
LSGGAIDIVCNIFTPEAVSNGWTGLDDAFKSQVRMDPAVRDGVTIEDYLRRMDRAGIERSLLIAVRAGDLRVRGSFEVPYDAIAKICRAHPDRFSGLAGVDPTRGIEVCAICGRPCRNMASSGRTGIRIGSRWRRMRR